MQGLHKNLTAADDLTTKSPCPVLACLPLRWVAMGRSVLVNDFALHSAQQGGRRRKQLPARNVHSASDLLWVCCLVWPRASVTVPADTAYKAMHMTTCCSMAVAEPQGFSCYLTVDAGTARARSTPQTTQHNLSTTEVVYHTQHNVSRKSADCTPRPPAHPDAPAQQLMCPLLPCCCTPPCSPPPCLTPSPTKFRSASSCRGACCTPSTTCCSGQPGVSPHSMPCVAPYTPAGVCASVGRCYNGY